MPKLLEMQFYVYENMKRMVLPSIGPCGQAAQPTTLQTVCTKILYFQLSLNMVTWDDYLLTARLWRTSGICCCLFHNPIWCSENKITNSGLFLSPNFSRNSCRQHLKLILWLQIPGSKTQHPSVYQALQSIRKREGPRGLYRFAHFSLILSPMPWCLYHPCFFSFTSIIFSYCCIMQRFDPQTGDVHVPRSYILCFIWILQEYTLSRRSLCSLAQNKRWR